MLVCDSLLASKDVERKRADLSKDRLNKKPNRAATLLTMVFLIAQGDFAREGTAVLLSHRTEGNQGRDTQ